MPLINSPTLSSPGVGSGLDVNGIVNSLVAIERRPIDLLKTANTKLETSLSSFGKLQSTLSALRDAADKLSRSDTWTLTSASSSDTSAVSLTTSAATKPGSYTIAVQSLASSQLTSSATYANSTDVLGEGILRISLGSWTADQTSFTPKVGATAVDISIGPGAKTLEQVRDSINGAGAGVTASIVTDSTGARLAIKSSATGIDNGFRISVIDTDGNSTDASGLSALAFDPANGVTSMSRNQAAGNAQATINGLAVNSTTNSLQNVIDGLNITLGKVTSTDVSVSVTQDTAAISKIITDFASAYSEAAKFLKDQTKYDATTKTAGILQGNRTATGMILQLRSVLTGTSTASSVYQRLADIGLDPIADGSIKVNGAKLNTALANLTELKSMLADPSTDPSQQGLAVRMRKFTESVLGIEGAVSTAKDSLQRIIDHNDKQQAQMEDRVARMEVRMRAQYTALDQKMGQLTGLSNYMTQQLAQFNKS